MAVKTKEEIKESVTAEVKSWFNKDTLEKIKKSLEYLIGPLCGLLNLWGVDAAVYITAGMGVLISIVAFLELFVKE